MTAPFTGAIWRRMKTFASILAALGIALPAAAQDAPPADRAQSAQWHNAQQIALAERTAAEGWSTLTGGVKFRRVAGDGTGPAPTVSDTVTVNYAGTLTDGTEFDSTEGRGPATFPLGNLVRAWQVAIPYMGIGDTIEIAAPSDMAYGPQGRGPIPPAATLFFTIELLGIEGVGK